jgi:hypothetical protein
MKRLWITLAVIALAAIVALPATAGAPDFCDSDLPNYNPDHPTCTTTTTTETPTTTTTIPDFAECIFDPDTGVLDNWHGHLDEERQCIWTVDNPGGTFEFQIDSLDGSVKEVKLPVLIVNDIVNGDIVWSDKCFHDSSGRGFQELPYPADSWTFSPASAGCGDGPYLLTISIQALKSELEKVDLVLTK